MKLTPGQKRLLNELAAKATPLSGSFFRSVEFRWMHPDDVISGRGAEKLGGRFARIGTAAVFASDSEDTVVAEITARRNRLGGRMLVPIDKYPRITFRLDIAVTRHVSLINTTANEEFLRLREGCLDTRDLAFSQLVGDHLRKRRIQVIRYQSVVSQGSNVIVFLENTRPGQLVLFNRARLLAQMASFRRSSKK